MKHLASAAFFVLLIAASSPDAQARTKQAPARKEPDLCVVPPGAQPLLPAKLLPGMGTTKNFPLTTKSEDARKFVLQGVSQIHSFWFQESERSCLQALEYDPNMAMAHWCIALSAAGDYRPAFQLLRDPASGGARGAAPQASPDAVTRTTNGAAVDPQIRAREAIAKAMALRDTVTPRERLYIEAQAARRAPGNKEAADAAYIAGLRKLVAAYPDDLDAKSMLGLAIDNGFESASKEPRAHTLEAIALLEAVVATGKPIVLVLENGRPLTIGWAKEHVPAILEAWYPGEFGGKAIAETLFGENNPAGRLTIIFPRSVGQLPDFYN